VKLLSLLAAIALCGCSYAGKTGVKTHVIFGFGIVRVVNTNAACVSVVNVKAAGVYTGKGTAALGWINQTCVEISTNANVLLEIKK
jgi:hypothetical protein